ncbi:MAG: AbrB/MazE/SpoVT family DNA-binding domain-containing protein [Synergistaceae bacterium]|jgi:AbrB family looped-hinge helix DNA binding protein|nr:AbrB/MazE/SpoVT family DNA-binding domain-containing protein [Synergistaceae bacterium]
MSMELAKITSKGQITLPIEIRRRLRLKDGDKVAFIEMGSQIVVANPIAIAIKDVQEAFAGEAERLELKDEEDVVSLVKEVRRNRKAKQRADRA